MEKRYRDLSSSLKKTFGQRVQKITVDAGFSCPNRDGTISTGGCIFCNPKGSGTGAWARGVSITRQLEEGKKFLAKRYKAKKFIAYFQSFTNTYGSLEKLKQVYDQALAVEDIVGLSIGTRPDCVDEGILDLIGNYAEDRLVWVEYGIQSTHDSTLAAINRGHDFNSFKNAVEATKGRGIKILAHVILGLPGENEGMMLQTADTLSKMGLDGIKIHLCYVVRGTELERLYNNGRYKCMTQTEYVSMVCDFLERLPEDMIIQRLTGDPHKEELAAPLWSLKKQETLNMIHEELTKRDTRQGRLAK